MAELELFAAVAAVLFVIYRMRQTGQGVSLRGLANPRVVAGIVLVAGVYGVSAWAVKRFTKPGHMSVIEAQAMDMTVMKPPVGAVPVAVMTLKREPMSSTVRYSGTAVAFLEQDVTPRVTGTIVWMPGYPGDKVRRGQAVARLDSAELGSKTREQAAGVSMAEHATAIARMQALQATNAARQAREQISESGSDVEMARNDVGVARQEEKAAEQDRVAAQADYESAQSGVIDARAQLTAAQADQTYWDARIKRSEDLFSQQVISRQEYQQDRAQVDSAASKVRQAMAKISQAESAVRAAQSRIRRAEAMIAGAASKVAAASSKVQAAQSKVTQAKDNAQALDAASSAASHEIPHSEAAVQQAEAQLRTARVVAGYTEIRADVEGVITQRMVSPGQLVQPGQSILRISQIDPIRVQINVAQSDLAQIHAGSRVNVRSMKDAGRAIEARVSAVFPAADPVARTSVVEAIVPNPDRRLLPGDFVSADFATGDSRDSLAVPVSAIVRQSKATSPILATDQTSAVWLVAQGTPEKTVYTCTMHPEVKQDHPGKCPVCGWELTPQASGGKWRAHLAPVTVGLTNASAAEILSGLREGDQVIYQGFEGLNEGDPVVPATWGAGGPVSIPPAVGEAPPGTIYTCPMHPEVRSDKPGVCPKCGMKLVPMTTPANRPRGKGQPE